MVGFTDGAAIELESALKVGEFAAEMAISAATPDGPDHRTLYLEISGPDDDRDFRGNLKLIATAILNWVLMAKNRGMTYRRMRVLVVIDQIGQHSALPETRMEDLDA